MADFGDYAAGFRQQAMALPEQYMQMSKLRALLEQQALQRPLIEAQTVAAQQANANEPALTMAKMYGSPFQQQQLAMEEKKIKPQEAWSPPYQSQGALVQRNMLTGEVRQAVARAPEMAQVAPVVEKDEQGNVRLYDRQGNLIKSLGKVGAPSPAYSKAMLANKKMATDINTAIGELEKATAEGGLIDKSTGSGAGALIDIGAGFFGKATPGSVAVGAMKPIFDLVLKMVPRFEGPQSDKDTLSYREAAGDLANPAVPNTRKKEAGKEILRLMKARRGQFISKEFEGTEADTAPAAAAPAGRIKFLGFENP